MDQNEIYSIAQTAKEHRDDELETLRESIDKRLKEMNDKLDKKNASEEKKHITKQDCLTKC